MKLIENNKMRFAIILEGNKPVATLTDGDIRRALLSGKSLDDNIRPHRDFKYIDFEDNFSIVCKKFRDFHVDFLLVLKNGNLFNVITRNQFHIMLLEDIAYKPDIDYSCFNDKKLDHEIYNRPWGFYKSVLLSSHVQAKTITVFPDSETSLQKHIHREEHWVIMKGVGRVVNKDNEFDVKSGMYVYVPKECKHQIINTSFNDNLVLSEVQLGEYFGEDDIIRFSDKYGRA
jgi:mannose-1-phosphate guanylyltransferase/mannose-6-phosphate isomerase